jgi:hypothetical protein
VKTLFVPCRFDGLTHAGSARIRADWVAANWEGAESYDSSQRFTGFDLYVFQKAYLSATSLQFITQAARWRDEGKCRLALDLCDPDFLDWKHRVRLMDVLPMFDFCVGATEPITEWLACYNYATTIPDCVDVDAVRQIGQAEYTDTDEPFLVWAGYDAHRDVILPLLGEIGQLGYTLGVVAVKSAIPFEDFWRQILRDEDGRPHDVLLNPRSDQDQYRYKSDNKTQIAHALGMPVAVDVADLRRLTDPEERRKEKPVRPISVAVEAWRELAEEWL